MTVVYLFKQINVTDLFKMHLCLESVSTCYVYILLLCIKPLEQISSFDYSWIFTRWFLNCYFNLIIIIGHLGHRSSGNYNTNPG